MQVRRAHSLIAYWEGEEFKFVNYLTSKNISANVLIAAVVDRAATPRTLHDLQFEFAHVPGVESILEALIRHSILLRVGSRIERRDTKVHETWRWGLDAQYFHFATKAVSYTFDFPAIRRELEARALREPPPSPFKTKLAATKIPLLKQKFEPKNYWEILSERRTCRDFRETPVSKQAFSNLLSSVSGMTRFYNESLLDKRIIKTSPSGGARHPVEAYCAVQNVRGIRPGVYHYEVETNSLAWIGEFPGREVIKRLFSGQDWVMKAAATFFFTAVLPRSMWKYDHSRAFKVTLLDAGHIGQTFHLTATALGLGVFTSAALQDSAIEKYLHIDGISEVVIYGGAIGHRTFDGKGKVRQAANVAT